MSEKKPKVEVHGRIIDNGDDVDFHLGHEGLCHEDRDFVARHRLGPDPRDRTNEPERHYNQEPHTPVPTFSTRTGDVTFGAAHIYEDREGDLQVNREMRPGYVHRFALSNTVVID